MNRIVSSILIPLLLVSQSLCSAPHSHAGSSIAEPAGHSTRPHVHLHVAGHHSSHDEDKHSSEPTANEAPDHDSDAIYTGETQLLNSGRVSKVAKPAFTAVFLVYDDAVSVATVQLCTQLTLPPLLRPKCALFLQFLSIRC